ncbi:DUF1707 SHOCT-like domain-containing protein [Nocardiopsis ansamitocini]|uniref:Cell wall-active antibiotics response LiaF-like C-terminal domain-containing protein n=1 Tax=Nocardiopsis ansamitocini TaxID=1670832 RepID=A0A9W6PB28_9ACTN|nr:DUF1707 domain-containing protein [Nocardiopsis ansamitocini]GLU50415.1 hypothetical protein Nans01_47660 [Nocardiopsis ansamitocini]
MNDSPVPGPNQMRASDADRDRVAARLRDALAEGRITPDEHSERLDSVYNSRTLGELVPITSDLPAVQDSSLPDQRAFDSPRPVYGRTRVTNGSPSGWFSLALMGGAERGGNWVVPKTYHALALMGGIGIDLREARFAAQETTIVANALMGGIEIVVPDDIEVRVSGVGIMGGYGAEGEAPSSVLEPGTPVVRVMGVGLMGAVVVIRKKRKHQKQATKEIEE